MPSDRLGRWLLFAVGWLSAAYFQPREPGWNVNTRLDLTMAIVDEHRLTIDTFHENPAFETGDKAFIGGHFYSDKVIGNSLAAVPVYQAAQWLGLAQTPLAKRWVCTAFTVSLAFGLLLVVMAGLMERQGVAPRQATLLAAMGGFGTMLFPYATILMPYAPACLFAMLAYRLALPPEPGGDTAEIPLEQLALAGLCAGVAVLFEFLFGLIGFAVWVHLIGSQRGRRAISAAVFAAMGLVGLLPYIIYSLAVFGSLAIPYAYEHDAFFREAMASGLAGIHFPPDPSILFLITFHPFRGLFVHSPMLLMAIPGFAAMWFLPRGPWRVAMSAGLALAYLLVNGGYLHQWWGGWACGPRLLIPAVPFLLLGVAAAWGRWVWTRPVIAALALGSIVLHLLAAGVDPQPPTPVPRGVGSANAYLLQARLDQWYPVPLTQCWLPRLRDGLVAWNPALRAGLPGVVSWLPLIAVWLTAAVVWTARLGAQAPPAERRSEP